MLESNNLELQLYLIVFLNFACYGLLYLRRNLKIFENSEFGGSGHLRYFTAVLMIFFLIIAIFLVTLASLGLIKLRIFI